MKDKIVIRSLENPEEMVKIEGLQDIIWKKSETDIIPSHLSLAIARNGGVIIGAFDKDRLVGFVLGFLGTDEESPERVAMARLKHCSHIMGVHPDYRNRGLAFRLKNAQRERVLEHGIRLITWTYDPLLSVNAQLNIRRLGAVCRTYIEDAYGAMRDGLNVGVSSDRFNVDWWITSPRVKSRIAGERHPLELAHFLSAGAQKINPTRLGSDDLLHPPDKVEDPQGNLVLVEIPPNFQELKSQDVELAKAWREQTRSIFVRAFAKGFLVTDFVYLGDERFPRSYYILSHGESTLG